MDLCDHLHTGVLRANRHVPQQISLPYGELAPRIDSLSAARHERSSRQSDPSPQKMQLSPMAQPDVLPSRVLWCRCRADNHVERLFSNQQIEKIPAYRKPCLLRLPHPSLQ
eukprot:4417710-Pleurochrysis_carterae.AAC.1